MCWSEIRELKGASVKTTFNKSQSKRIYGDVCICVRSSFYHHKINHVLGHSNFQSQVLNGWFRKILRNLRTPTTHGKMKVLSPFLTPKNEGNSRGETPSPKNMWPSSSGSVGMSFFCTPHSSELGDGTLVNLQ